MEPNNWLFSITYNYKFFQKIKISYFDIKLQGFKKLKTSFDI